MPIVELEQNYEISVTTSSYPWGAFSVRFSYRRSRDSQMKGDTGQDYLIFQVRPQRIVFALCDGVGQSFQGHLGAQILGRSLREWLWTLPNNLPLKQTDIGPLVINLRRRLNYEKESATDLIHRISLNELSSDLLREVQIERREKSGTQSNFVCGVIDAPTKEIPNGQLLLFWLGDAKLQIWSEGQNRSEALKAVWDSKEGWSSKYGVTGDIQTFLSDLIHIDTLFAFSDGADPIQDELVPGLPAEILDSKFISLLDLPKNDDISFIEIGTNKAGFYRREEIAQAIPKEIPERSTPERTPVGGIGEWFSKRTAKTLIILMILFIIASISVCIYLTSIGLLPVGVVPTPNQMTVEAIRSGYIPVESTLSVPTIEAVITGRAPEISEKLNLTVQAALLENEAEMSASFEITAEAIRTLSVPTPALMTSPTVYAILTQYAPTATQTPTSTSTISPTLTTTPTRTATLISVTVTSTQSPTP